MDLLSGSSSTSSVTMLNQTELTEINGELAKVEAFKSFTFFVENIKEIIVIQVKRLKTRSLSNCVHWIYYTGT